MSTFKVKFELINHCASKSGETGKLKMKMIVERMTNVVENWREGKSIWREQR